MAGFGRQVVPNNTVYHGSTAALGPKKVADPYSNSMGNYGQPYGNNTTQPYNAPIYSTGANTPGTSNTGATTQAGGAGTAGATGYTGGVPGANGSIYNSADANYIRNLQTSYTPDQVLQMKNNARNLSTAANQGTELKLRELMGQQGMGGSGYEAANIYNQLSSQNKDLGNVLSNIDINAANTDLANKYSKAGLLNTLMGTGMDENKLSEMGRQFDIGQYNDLYKWGNETDYQRYLDRQSNNQYKDQLRQMLQMLGIGGL